MQHLDEGMIHAWLDGELPPAEAEQIEAHTRECAECAQRVAEARGLIAASTRILNALDNVPSGVVPGAAATIAPARIRRWYDRTDLRAAAALLFVVGASLVAVKYGRNTSTSLQTMSKTESSPLASAVILDSASPTMTEASKVAEAPQAESRRESRRIAASPPAVSSKAFGSVQAMDEVSASKAAEAPPVAQSAVAAPPLMRLNAGIAQRKAAVNEPSALAGAVGGVARSDAAGAGRIEGRVVDSAAGKGLVAAYVAIAGTTLSARSDQNGNFVIDSVPAGERHVVIRRIGYAVQDVPVVVKENSAAAANIALSPLRAQLNEVVVLSGTTESVPSLRVLKMDSTAATRHVVYEVSPGVQVTLADSLTNITDTKDLKIRDKTMAAPATVTAPMAVTTTMQSESKATFARPPIKMISWTDGNHHYTLSGPLTVRELEAIKPRIIKMRR